MGKQTQLQFFTRTSEVWDAMYNDCTDAEKSIEFEQYILRDDTAGKRFLRLFRDKARQGLRVRLILDPLGSRSLRTSPILKEIKEAGGIVHFYNVIGWLNLLFPRRCFPRNHNKTMLVDSRIAYVGSACVEEYMHDWHDLHARITGSLVEEVKQDFDRIRGRSHFMENMKLYQQDLLAHERPFRYISTRPQFLPSPIYHELLHEIRKAKTHVYLVAPYFVPPLRFYQALREAVKRGVDVHVMMSEKTDVPVADYVSHTYLPLFIRDGIRIFFYKDCVLHAKYAIIDGNWATMGSTNMDYLSLRHNREANIIIRDAETISELLRQYKADMGNCGEATLSYWKAIPFSQKVKGYAGRTIKKIL
jgi:cardiolipin synthase A/B